MKLTKIQRYTCYCIMLSEAEKPTSFVDCTGKYRKSNDCGLCFMASRIFARNIEKVETHLSYSKSGKLFKEYFKLYNKRVGAINWAKRIEILKQCIKETHP